MVGRSSAQREIAASRYPVAEVSADPRAHLGREEAP